MRYIIELVSASKFAVDRDNTPSGWVDDISDAKKYTREEMDEMMSYFPFKTNIDFGIYKIHRVNYV